MLALLWTGSLTRDTERLVIAETGETGRGRDEDRMRRRPWHCGRGHLPGAVLNLFLLGLGGCGYLVNQAVLKAANAEFFQYYFNDVLAALILLAWSNLIAGGTPAARWVGSVGGSAVIIAGASLAWEVGAPWLLATAQSDPWDVLAYAGGGAIYLLLAAGRRHRLARRLTLGSRKTPTLRTAKAAPI